MPWPTAAPPPAPGPTRSLIPVQHLAPARVPALALALALAQHHSLNLRVVEKTSARISAHRRYGVSAFGQGGMRVRRDDADHAAGDGPSFVISPRAVDEQQVGRVALVAEAELLDQPHGGMVAGLDLGFQPVESQLLKGIAQHEAEAFGHVALARRGGEGCIGERAALEASADDAVYVDHAGDGSGVTHADQQ